MNMIFKARKYRGKYPNRIRAVSSSKGITLIETNDGANFYATPKYLCAPMPTLGDTVRDGVVFLGETAIANARNA